MFFYSKCSDIPLNGVLNTETSNLSYVPFFQSLLMYFYPPENMIGCAVHIDTYVRIDPRYLCYCSFHCKLVYISMYMYTTVYTGLPGTPAVS